MKSPPLPPGQTLRDWQRAAFGALGSAVRSGIRCPVIQASTGSGKGTFLASTATALARSGHRVLILVHRRELIEDLHARTVACGGRAGVVQGPRVQMGAPIVVASVASLQRRLEVLPAFSWVITDECHHATAQTYRKVIESIDATRSALGQPPCHHLGVSATPWRSDGHGGRSPIIGAGQPYDAIIFQYGLRDAIADGVLVPPIGHAVDTHVSIAGVKISGGDYDEAELSAAIDIPERNRLVVDMYRRLAIGRQFLAFAVSVEHAQHLAEAFVDAGFPVAAAWGAMPVRDRRSVIERLHSGALLGIVSKDLLFEGFDAPSISCLLRNRPTASSIIGPQMLGRGLRIHPGKKDCLVVDFIDDGALVVPMVDIDMSDVDQDRQARAWTPVAGELVVHRYADRGVGQVDQVEGPVVTVRWPMGVEVHGAPELRKWRIEGDTDGEPALDLRVTGHSVRPMTLLPGSTMTHAYIWVGDTDTGGQPIWGCGGAGRGCHAQVLIRRLKSGVWSTWIVVATTKTDATARKLCDERDLTAAQRAGLDALRSLGVQGVDLTATSWTSPATASQIAVLRLLGCDIDARLTQGDALGLIATRRARQVVTAHVARLRSEHASKHRHNRACRSFSAVVKFLVDGGNSVQ